MHTPDLLGEIETFLAKPGVGMRETTFGRLAVNDGKFLARLRRGGRVWPETEEKIRNFIASRKETSQ